jgi:hypothetical protein
MKSYTKWLEEDAVDCGILAPPMNALLGITFLKNYLFDDFSFEVTAENVSTIVFMILHKYSLRFRMQLFADRFRKTPKTLDIIPDNAQDGLDMIANYLWFKDWYVADPLSQEQINTVVVCEILDDYSKEFRTEMENFRLRKATA